MLTRLNTGGNLHPFRDPFTTSQKRGTYNAVILFNDLAELLGKAREIRQILFHCSVEFLESLKDLLSSVLRSFDS